MLPIEYLDFERDQIKSRNIRQIEYLNCKKKQNKERERIISSKNFKKNKNTRILNISSNENNDDGLYRLGYRYIKKADRIKIQFCPNEKFEGLKKLILTDTFNPIRVFFSEALGLEMYAKLCASLLNSTSFDNIINVQDGCDFFKKIYTLESVLCRGTIDQRTLMLDLISNKLSLLTTSPFNQNKNNILKKYVFYGDRNHIELLLEFLSTPFNDKYLVMHRMAKDKYANYVIQYLLEAIDDKSQTEYLIANLLLKKKRLKNNEFGRYVITKIKSMKLNHQLKIN